MVEVDTTLQRVISIIFKVKLFTLYGTEMSRCLPYKPIQPSTTCVQSTDINQINSINNAMRIYVIIRDIM